MHSQGLLRDRSFVEPSSEKLANPAEKSEYNTGYKQDQYLKAILIRANFRNELPLSTG